VTEKDEMRDLAMRGGPFTDRKREISSHIASRT